MSNTSNKGFLRGAAELVGDCMKEAADLADYSMRKCVSANDDRSSPEERIKEALREIEERDN